MKTMTCKQLGGACNEEFHANTFEEMAEMSKKHGMEMFQAGDEAHIKAMNEMIYFFKRRYLMCHFGVRSISSPAAFNSLFSSLMAYFGRRSADRT